MPVFLFERGGIQASPPWRPIQGAEVGGFDAGADGVGRFAGVGAVEVAEVNGRDLDVDVDAVEERAGEPLAISAELIRRAAAFAFGIAEVPAGA